MKTTVEVPDDLYRRAKAEAAMDALRDKFGNKSIETGYTFGRGKRGHA